MKAFKMNTQRILVSLTLVFSFFVLAAPQKTSAQKEAAPKEAAQKETVIRMATIAPKGSSWMKIMNAWNRTVKKETDGQVKFRFYAGGVAGDERDFIRKIRAGQLDGAAVTTTGLGQVVKSALVLAAPGLITSYKDLDDLRSSMQNDLDKAFSDAGFYLLSWGDGGLTRMFSAKPIVKPADMKTSRPWLWKGTQIFPAFVKAVGANGVELGLPEVYPALQTGMVDLVPSSALATVALQWYTKLPYVTKDPIGVVVGGIIVKKDVMDGLSPAHQAVLKASGKKVEKILTKRIRADDSKAFKTLVARKETVVVDQKAHRAEWEKAAKTARQKLAGRVYPKALLLKAEKILKK